MHINNYEHLEEKYPETWNLINKKAAIYFDLDGTLVDSEKVYISVFQSMAKLEELSIPTKLLTEMVGATNFQIYKEYNKLGGKFSLIEFEKKIHEEFLQIFSSDPFHFLAKGSISFLNYLYQQNKIVRIVTSSHRQIAIKILELTKLPVHSKNLICFEDIHQPKPLPGAYLKALRKDALYSWQVLVFEDSLFGVLAAKGAGLEVVRVDLTT